MPRPLIAEASKLLGLTLRKGVTPLILVFAPTSYGKTTSSPMLYAELRKSGLASSYMHVMPLRALVREAMKSALEGPARIMLQGIVGSNISRAVGYQAMALSLEGKTPYYTREIIYTTMHSFLLNLARIPVAEALQNSRHFELPRAYILSSLTVFDEAHLYGGLPQFHLALRFLAQHGVPIVVETATPTPSLSRIMAEEAANIEPHAECIEVKLKGMRTEAACREILVEDNEFKMSGCSAHWFTRIIDTPSSIYFERLSNEALRSLREGRRTLVVLNTPEQTVKVKRILERQGVKAPLIHGRMTTRDREESIRLYEEGKTQILVGTQAVEAGLNLGFDAIITAPTTPSSLIQRAGRAARSGGEGIITIVYSEELEELGPYKPWEKEIRGLLEFLEELVDKYGPTSIQWRCPFKKTGEKVSPVDLALYEPAPKSGAGPAGLIRLMASPAIGSSLIDELLKLDPCVMLGEELLVLTLRVGGMGEIPVGPDQVVKLAAKDILQICRENGCQPLGRELVKMSRRERCRYIWRNILFKGAYLSVSPGLYRRGEGLVFD